jgi:hypothetical protein
LRVLLASLIFSTSTLWLGCGFDLNQPMPEPRRYLVRAEFSGDSGPPCEARLRVGRFRVAPLFEREGLVYLRGDDDYRSSFYERFERPPGVMLRGATLAWLRQAELFIEVLEPGDPGVAEWLLEARVRKLYADVRRGDGPQAVLEIDFSVADDDTAATVVQRTYGQAARVGSSEAGAVVLGWDQALSEILSGLGDDLREMLEARGLCD